MVSGDRMAASGMAVSLACLEISHILQARDCFPGKSRVAFVVGDAREYCYSTLGDMRIYWLGEGCRTRDHSLAERWATACLTPCHGTRCATGLPHGGASGGSLHGLEWHQRAPQPDQHLLLCSDEFWSQVSDADISAIHSAAALHAMCGPPAKQHLSPDNLPVALLVQGALADEGCFHFALLVISGLSVGSEYCAVIPLK